MITKRKLRTLLVCLGWVTGGLVGGFAAGIVVFVAFGTHGNAEAPGAGFLLLIAWLVLIPLCLVPAIWRAATIWKRDTAR
jgi:hypothetical protein